MAWMLEEITKALLGITVGLFLKGVMQMAVGDKCFIKECSRPAVPQIIYRGLCFVCYSSAKRKIKTEGATWEKLEELGLCKPAKDPFDDAYSKAMEGN